MKNCGPYMVRQIEYSLNIDGFVLKESTRRKNKDVSKKFELIISENSKE